MMSTNGERQMYCITMEYPQAEGSKFDYDDDVHMPLCARLLAG
jgi:hypothetical protein